MTKSLDDRIEEFLSDWEGTDTSELDDILRELQAENKRLREALEFYAWTPYGPQVETIPNSAIPGLRQPQQKVTHPILDDDGKRARAALKSQGSPERDGDG